MVMKCVYSGTVAALKKEFYQYLIITNEKSVYKQVKMRKSCVCVCLCCVFNVFESYFSLLLCFSCISVYLNNKTFMNFYFIESNIKYIFYNLSFSNKEK